MPEIAGHSHITAVTRSFQNTNTPDIDLERDAIAVAGSFIENQTDKKGIGSIRKNKKYQFNLSTIIMSALIFLAILAWFDFIQTAFYCWLAPDTQSGNPSPQIKLYYALLSTGFVAALCGLLVIYAEPLRI